MEPEPGERRRMKGRTMKKILVTTLMTTSSYNRLKRAADGGDFPCEFFYVPIYRSIPKWMQKEPMQEPDDTLENIVKVKDFSAIFGDTTSELLNEQEKLEWLQINSAGFDKFEAPGSLPEGCTLTSARGVYGTVVSEHMIALTFDLIRRFPAVHKNQAVHRWTNPGMVGIVEGSTVVVVGLGDIGSTYAKKMKALGAYVIGVRKSRKEKEVYLDEQYTEKELDSVIPRGDILALVVPGGTETEKLMDERRLRLMKEDSVLINVGRGNAIDQKTLCQMLKEGHFLGVGLDVTDPEPLPEDDPLWNCDNLTVTPHAAGIWKPETYEKLIALAEKNLYAFTHHGTWMNAVKGPGFQHTFAEEKPVTWLEN